MLENGMQCNEQLNSLKFFTRIQSVSQLHEIDWLCGRFNFLPGLAVMSCRSIKVCAEPVPCPTTRVEHAKAAADIDEVADERLRAAAFRRLQTSTDRRMTCSK